MDINYNLNNSKFWQELSNEQEELIQGGVANSHVRIKVLFSLDRGSITNESSPGGGSVNEIRWHDQPGINK